MEKNIDITEVIKRIDKSANNLFKNRTNPYGEFLDIYKYIKDYYIEFIGLLPSLNEIGLEISSERLLQDIKDMSEAIKGEDKVFLFDTLMFRVKETLSWYSQILEIMNNG